MDFQEILDAVQLDKDQRVKSSTGELSNDAPGIRKAKLMLALAETAEALGAEIPEAIQREIREDLANAIKLEYTVGKAQADIQTERAEQSITVALEAQLGEGRGR